MVWDPNELMRRRAFGGLSGMMFPGARPTEERRIGALGMYIPAGNTTVNVRPTVSQGVWGQPSTEVSSRPVGTMGPGETSSIPSQIQPGIGEEAWRTPTGSIIAQSDVDAVSPAPLGDVSGGTRGTEEVRGLANIVSKPPTETPSAPASVGSPTPPGQGGSTVGMSLAPEPSPYKPTAPTASPAAPQAQAPAPTPSVNSYGTMEVGRGENQYTTSVPQGLATQVAKAMYMPARQRTSSQQKILSGFGSRSGGLWGLVQSALSNLFSRWGGRR